MLFNVTVTDYGVLTVLNKATMSISTTRFLFITIERGIVRAKHRAQEIMQQAKMTLTSLHLLDLAHKVTFMFKQLSSY